MKGEDLKERTQQFALRVIRLTRALPKTQEGREIGNQLLRCGMSVGANYRAACRGRSRREFVAKLGIAEEEADESCYWMELIIKAEIMKAALVQPLWAEAEAILRIIVASYKRAVAGAAK